MPETLKTASEAEMQIAALILDKSLEERFSWTLESNVFSCKIDDSLSAQLVVSTSDVTKAARWENFSVREKNRNLVSYSYPSAYSQSMGLSIAPVAVKVKIDALFNKLRSVAVENAYGSVLERLKALK